ncbi:MAG TPA: HAD-IIIC family phosphatase [Candidatus Dormibacteraeota bacterium]|nr:HAD-IIIC family phosphatase [Candidatus Dormibacteraeota bacterium]
MSDTAEASAAEAAMMRAEWQHVVFAAEPRRLALLELRAPWPLRPVRISVLRNHTVETSLSSLRGFLAYAGYVPEVVLSGYDDALSTAPVAAADVHLVWLDLSHYANAEIDGLWSWLADRVRFLRSALTGPIVVVDAGPALAGFERFNASLREAIDGLPDAHVFPLSAAVPPAVDGASVEERASSTGTALSGRDAVALCQHLGLCWIPALLQPRLKAIVLDLDNTVVGGVLAEDGAANVRTDGTYARLRERLLALHQEGVLLALVSKNDVRDVDGLFAQRPELEALRHALVAVEAGWQDKASSVRAIAARLHVGTDSLLIVDDNPGEIAAMASALPSARFLWAEDPGSTERALTLYPGLLELRHDAAASARMSDLQAAERRAAAAQTAIDPAAYVASLQVQIRLRADDHTDRTRLSELSRKTNQFNTSLARFGEVEVDDYLTRADRRVVSVRLRDRLSDSGLVGAVFARRDGGRVVIDEIAISCRALGRSLEPAMLAAALRGVAEGLDAQTLLVPFVAGPRNEPAHAWLAAFADSRQGGDDEYLLSTASLEARVPRLPIDIQWENGGG